MDRRNTIILAAIVISFVLCATLIPRVWADTFSTPGDLNVGDDAIVADDVTVAGNVSITGQASFATYVCPDIPQLFVIEWCESAAHGKSFPDTFTGMAAEVCYIPRIEGRIEYVDLFMDTAGSGWDSLKVDLLAGTNGDTTVFSLQPMLEASDGDEAITSTSGRDAQYDATHRIVEKGEVINIDVSLDGSKASPPSGIKIWLYFKPDYEKD